MTEVRASLSFGNYRHGGFYEVDTGDATVAGLIKAGYLKVVSDGTDSLDSAGAEPGPAGDLDPGMARDTQAEEDVDGAGSHQPGEENSPRAQGDSPLHSPDQ